MSYNDDKRELLKLKQGLVDETDSPIEIQPGGVSRTVKPVGKAAVANFIYHHKLHIILVAFFLTAALIFLYFALTDEKEDIIVLFIADSEEAAKFFQFESAGLEKAIEAYTPDFNNDGNIHAECRFISLITQVGEVGRNPDAVYGDRIKLFGEVSAGDSMIYIGNKKALESIPGEEIEIEDFYTPLWEFDDKADGVFLAVCDTVLKEQTQISLAEIPDDLYIALRKVSTPSKFYAFAKTVLMAIAEAKNVTVQ
jgi:hypothetical protein